MKPPVDASKLSEAAKAAAGEFGDPSNGWPRSAAPRTSLTNAEFRSQLEKTLGSSKEVNQAMSVAAIPGGPAERLGPDPVHAEQPGARL